MIENKKYRVRFFTHQENDYSNIVTKSKERQFWDVAELFKETPQYSWIENNDVELQWHEDDVYVGYGKQYIIYADLNESQYTDYGLRFFRHMAEWK